MDPNEALKQIRELRAELFERGEPYDPETVRQLIELIDGLDSWLSRDGFLPADWRSDDEKAEDVVRCPGCGEEGYDNPEHCPTCQERAALEELVDLGYMHPDTTQVLVLAEHRRSRGEVAVYGPYDNAALARQAAIEKYTDGTFDTDGCEIEYKQRRL